MQWWTERGAANQVEVVETCVGNGSWHQQYRKQNGGRFVLAWTCHDE